ncbi:hypothetical protein D910_11872 [Dendroctonus ponderosae]
MFDISGDIKGNFVKEGADTHCICLPYWECKDVNQATYKEDFGLSEVRSNENNQNILSAKCSGYLDVCCKVKCGIQYSMAGHTTNMHKRILGDADIAEFGEFPWMLGILDGTVYKCGGSLIHPKVALTAAHCVTAPVKYTVRAGEWHWKHMDEPLLHQDRTVAFINIHPQFDSSSLRNDIALLVLKSPFKLTSHVGIICVPPPDLNVDTTRCTAAGWGRNSKHGVYQPILKKVDLPIVPFRECERILQKTLGPLFELDDTFICAGGEPGKDTCKGDGGSPLMCPITGETNRYQQVGVVSWGIICGLTQAPGAYVNVMLYSDWIDGEMIKMSLKPNIYRHNYDIKTQSK